MSKSLKATWKTIPTGRQHLLKLETPWKRYLGDSCPHHLNIALVNGTHVRNAYDSDFSQGGNGYAYDFVPKDEIWIDEAIDPIEWPFIAFHECEEAELMKKGLSYDDAHDRAKHTEDLFRHSLMERQ
jgi:hypothetical protein